MSTKPKAGKQPSRHTTKADSTAAVEEFLAQCDHPCKAEMEALRQIILGADASIQEGIKWNAPSFRTSEYFATFHLRMKSGIGLILHLGAKVKDNAGPGMSIEDPSQLLKWLSADRALISFEGAADVEAKKAAFAAILRQWVRFVA